MNEQEMRAVVAQMKQQHGSVVGYPTPDGRLLVIRKCTPMERARVVDKLAGKGNSSPAAARKELARGVAVYPENQGERDAIFDEYPALLDKCADRTFELAGFDFEELGKD